MIKVNLLPINLRKKEPTPLPQFLIICCAFIILGYIAYQIARYTTDIIPSLLIQVEYLKGEQADLNNVINEINSLKNNIAARKSYIDDVKNLYTDRIVWSKILSDLKNIVDSDSITNTYNNELKYLWLTTLSCTPGNISLTGYATAAEQLTAIKMQESFIISLLTYSPVILPEKDEESRLRRELATLKSQYEEARLENIDLPSVSLEIANKENRLNDIGKIKSGGIATIPFYRFIQPGSLVLNSVSWVDAPSPNSKSTDTTVKASSGNTENYPKKAWSFNITMGLIKF